MRGSPLRHAWGVLREMLVGIGTWLVAVTGLFVLFHAGTADPVGRLLPAGADPEAATVVRAELGLDRPLPVQWLEWVWNYTTLGYGRSLGMNVSVREVVLPAVGRSLLLAGVTTAVVVIFGVVVLAAVAVAADSRARPVVVALTSLPGTVTAVLVVSLLFVPWAVVGTPPIWSRSGLGNQIIVLLTMALAIAAPVLGWTARRVGGAFAGRPPDQRSLRAAVSGVGARGLRRWPLHLWLVGSYAAGALVAVETLFAYPGVGFLLAEAVVNRDVLLALGVTAAVLKLSVAAGVVRNVLWAAGGVMVTADGDDGSADGPTDAAPRERRDPDPGLDPESESDPESTEPAVVTTVRTVFVRWRVLLGVAWLGVLTVVGLGGSLLLSPETPSLGGTVVALGPGQVFNTTGVLLVVALGAFVLGGVPGAVLGSIAGELESSIGGALGRAGATLLRVPTDFLLVGPLVVVVVVWKALVGMASGRAGTELLLVALGGLAVGAYAFRTAQAAVAATPDGWGVGNRVAAAVPAGLDGSGDAAVVVAFAACELAVLGLVPRRSVPAFAELGTIVQSGTGVVGPGIALAALFQATLPVVAVAVGVFLLGDGLGAGSRTVRRQR